MPDTPEVRYCHGCGQYDDAPRVQFAVDINRPELDKLYHYDCAPHDVAANPVLEPIMSARASGKKNDKLREFAVAHAAKIEEDAADDENGS